MKITVELDDNMVSNMYLKAYHGVTLHVDCFKVNVGYINGEPIVTGSQKPSEIMKVLQKHVDRKEGIS